MALTGEAKRQYQLEWIRKRRDAWIKSQGGKCVKCGSTEELHVDHIDPATKKYNPAGIWSRTAAVREAELAKCQVLCRTCHEAKTAYEFTLDSPHGTTTRYDKGCRCQDCRDSKAATMRKSRANRIAV